MAGAALGMVRRMGGKGQDLDSKPLHITTLRQYRMLQSGDFHL